MSKALDATSIISLIVTVLSVVGLVFLTNMAFDSELRNGQLCTPNMTVTKRNFARLTIVLMWIPWAIFALMLIGSLFGFGAGLAMLRKKSI